MTLAAEVTARLSTQYLTQITNPLAPGITVPDTDRLADACADVAAQFEVRGAGAFDATDAKHIAVAINGVVGTLLQWTGHSSEESQRQLERFEDGLKMLRRVQHANKVAPTTARTGTALVDRFPRSAIKYTKPTTPNAASSDNTEP